MRSEPPTDWHPVRLGDLVSIEHGFAFKSEFFCEAADDVPVVVSVGNFEYSGGFRFGDTGIKGYLGEFPDRFRLTPGDILLVMTCQTQGGEILGIPGRIPDDGRAYLHNQRLGRVTFRDPDRLDPSFAYWLFLDPAFNRALCQTATGSKILHTAPSRIEAYVFALAPLAEQRRIAALLGALDEKVDCNRRLASRLEETAATIFRARFVDLVAVDAFEDSEVGLIPGGWRSGTVADLAWRVRESVQPSAFPDAPYEHFSIPAFDNGRHPDVTTGATMLSGKTVIPEGDAVLISKLNPATRRVWWPKPAGIGQAVSSPEFIVLVPHAGIPNSYLYALLVANDQFYNDLLSHVTGTTGSRQRVKPGDLMACHALLPDPAALEDWDRLVRPLYDHIHALLAENLSLSSLRDALLPKLVSGEIRVPEAADHGEAIREIAATAQ